MNNGKLTCGLHTALNGYYRAAKDDGDFECVYNDDAEGQKYICSDNDMSSANLCDTWCNSLGLDLDMDGDLAEYMGDLKVRLGDMQYGAQFLGGDPASGKLDLGGQGSCYFICGYANGVSNIPAIKGKPLVGAQFGNFWYQTLNECLYG